MMENVRTLEIVELPTKRQPQHDLENSWLQRGDKISELSSLLVEEKIKYHALLYRYETRETLIDHNAKEIKRLTKELFEAKLELKNRDEILDELYQSFTELEVAK